MFAIINRTVPYKMGTRNSLISKAKLCYCKRTSIVHRSPSQLIGTRFDYNKRNEHFISSTSLQLLFPHSFLGTDFVCFRYLNTTSTLCEEHSSKVEQTVKALKEAEEEKKKKQEETTTAVKPTTEAETAVVEKPKRSLLKRFWDELVHYYHGFRLLFIDIKVLRRLVWKVLNGGSLTRREHKQMVRTVADIFRLVPFLVFVIVPFMEFLLPVFLKLFPSMLPSTFQTDSDKETKVKRQLKLKIDMAKFLQQTLDEMALKAQGESHSQSAKEFVQFLEKIRKSGAQATNEEILKFSKFFNDDLTLDSLSRPQLIALCRLLELKPMGTNNFLRFQLEMRLRSLKADDQMIQKEGITSLTIPELQQACRARGMRALGVPEERLRLQLQQWLELSLNENIPSSLLLLSRVLYLPEDLPATDQLKATILSLPDVAATEAKYQIGETEGKIDNKTKIELIKKEEEAIAKEKEELETAAKALKEKLVDTAVPILDKAKAVSDIATDLNVKPVAQSTEGEAASEPSISKEDIASLENALDEISKEKYHFLLEKEELQELKEEMEEYKEDIEEFKELALTEKHGLKETKAAKRLRKRVDKMLGGLDKVYSNLESKRQSLQAQIDSMVKEGKDVTAEEDDLVNINEFHKAIRKIQKVGDEAKFQKILDVLDMMDVDNDGYVKVEHVMKLIELLEREQIQVSTSQVKDIINVLMQEEKLEDEQKKAKLQKSKLQEMIKHSVKPRESGTNQKNETA